MATIALRDAAGRRLLGIGPTQSQATTQVMPWLPEDVDHITLSLSVSGEQTPVATRTVTRDHFTDPVVFPDLPPWADFVLVGRAYRSADDSEPIDRFGVDAASCTTQFQTRGAMTHDIGPIAIRLANKVFAGRGRTGIAVTDGQVHDTTAATAIQLAP
ncbi:MAG: hypothetical protein ACK46X_20270 [Candidatus Sericytochromatia bacterium]